MTIRESKNEFSNIDVRLIGIAPQIGPLFKYY